jgi:hypothetical protein
MPQGQQTIPSNHQNPEAMKLAESIKQVTELRAKGWTYQSIANALGMSKQRAHQIDVLARKREHDSGLWTNGLSVRNIKILEKLNINSRDVAIHAVKVGDIKPFKWANFGYTSYYDLCAWLGVEPGNHSRNSTSNKCPHCGQHL